MMKAGKYFWGGMVWGMVFGAVLALPARLFISPPDPVICDAVPCECQEIHPPPPPPPLATSESYDIIWNRSKHIGHSQYSDSGIGQSKQDEHYIENGDPGIKNKNKVNKKYRENLSKLRTKK